MPTCLTRYEVLEQLKQYYLGHFVEDGLDGSPFDCDILDALEALQDKYKEQP